MRGNLAKEQNDNLLEASDLLNLASVEISRERFDESIDWSEQALEATKKIGSPSGEKKASGNLGWAYYKFGISLEHCKYFQRLLKKPRLGLI
jgi:tetratricopeptide (TPR) repeat protein